MSPLTFVQPVNEPISKEIFLVLNDKRSRFSLIPKEVIEKNIAPFLRNPFTVCRYVESNEYTIDKNSEKKVDVKNKLKVMEKRLFDSWRIYEFNNQNNDFKLSQTLLGESLLFRACKTGRLEAVKNVLAWDESRRSLNSGNAYFQAWNKQYIIITPLLKTIYFSCGKERREICELLLNQGADPNKAGYSSNRSFTPLWAAIKVQDVFLTEMLMDKGGYIFPPLNDRELEFFNQVKQDKIRRIWGHWA